MRRSKTESLSGVIKALKSEYKLNEQLDKAHIKRTWSDIVGKNACRYTDKIYFRGNSLYVHLKSPVLRYELSGQRKLLLDRINKSVGYELVNEIIFK